VPGTCSVTSENCLSLVSHACEASKETIVVIGLILTCASSRKEGLSHGEGAFLTCSICRAQSSSNTKSSIKVPSLVMACTNSYNMKIRRKICWCRC
jgi:hypothetical protein